MKNRHFCVICMLLPVIFLCTILAGCGKESQADPADVPFLSQVCTQDLEALPHTMEVRWQSGDLELLDATEGEGGYFLLVQDANDTYQITLDDNFNEVNRQKTSVSHAKRFLHTKQGVFAYAPNESGTYDVWKDLSHLQGCHKEKPPEMDGFNYFRYSPRPEGGSLGYSSSSKLSNGPLRPERWSLVYSTFSSTPLSISFLACAEGSAE